MEISFSSYMGGNISSVPPVIALKVAKPPITISQLLIKAQSGMTSGLIVLWYSPLLICFLQYKIFCTKINLSASVPLPSSSIPLKQSQIW